MRYETHTKLAPDDVMKRADEFFGLGGLGLQERQRLPGLAMWEGGGGTVNIEVRSDEKRGSVVELTTSEWDSPVREFIGKIGGRG